MAALEEGLITPSRKIEDPGHWEYGGREYQNAKEAVFGSIDVREALAKSSDIFFFKLGAQANDRGRVIQKWAERFGYGSKTGIDLPGETAGPGARPQVAQAGLRQVPEVRRRRPACSRGRRRRCYECGGIERGWSGGDNVNLAVGQGDLQATPLQVAVAYAALENGGTVVRPHLGKAIEDGNGVPLQEFRPKAAPQDQDGRARPRRRARRPARAPRRARAVRPRTCSPAGR